MVQIAINFVYLDDFLILIAPNASCIIAGAKSITAEPIGSLSALSGDGFEITAMPPTIMNIPDELNLEKFNSLNQADITPGETPNIELTYELFRTNDNLNKVYKIKGNLFTQRKIVNQISPELETLFTEYVNPRFNFDELETLSDDTARYTRTNILPRYEVETVQVYGKFVPIGESDTIIENKYNVQELIQNGFTLLNDVIISGIKANDYDRTFEYTLPRDQDVILAFVIKIKSN